MTSIPDHQAGNGQIRPGEMSAAELDELGARIPFGERPNQTVPASWASAMLTLLNQQHPDLFIALMGEAATGHHTEAPARRRNRRGDE